ncbi:hypothetical protein GmHk_15G044364 [Glycine max]|nr:hypothetical protein GmHk_15G044364 [Glycine max]
MGEIEEMQERMKADMEAMKEKMATMMEAMMSMKKIMEVNAAAVAATSAIAEVDLTPLSGLNQINHPTSDRVGQGSKELGIFASERIEVGLKRGKFDYPALMNEKPGANGENEEEGGTHAVTVIPTWPNQACQYSTNIDPSHYPPPNQP